MNMQKLLIISAIVCLVGAISGAALLPARIGTHSDEVRVDKSPINRSTEARYATLISYYLTASPASERQDITIGTEPYTNFYARTWAAELWILSGVLMLVGILVRSKRGTTNQE